MKLLSRVRFFATPWTNRLLHSWDFPGTNTGVGCHFLRQEIFPTQGLNLGLLPCRQMLYHLSHQGSPSVMKEDNQLVSVMKGGYRSFFKEDIINSMTINVIILMKWTILLGGKKLSKPDRIKSE